MQDAVFVEFDPFARRDDDRRHRIADDGRGIGAGNAGRIFDPFFTTRRDAGGTGMGLTIVQTLLSAHGARIALDDQVTGGGAAFVIYFD